MKVSLFLFSRNTFNFFSLSLIVFVQKIDDEKMFVIIFADFFSLNFFKLKIKKKLNKNLQI